VQFDTPSFLCFALIFFLVFRRIASQRLRLAWLLAASIVFYGAWDPRYLLLIGFSGALDFLAALRIAAAPTHRRRRWWLGLSLAGNLGVLFFFKYAMFAWGVASETSAALGFGGLPPSWQIVLPVGISFYTLQSLSYTIDVYRGELEPTRSPLLFFAYLAMFPQLVAGPIVRARQLFPQLAARRDPTDQQAWDGWYLIAMGFFKKAFLADNIAPVVNEAFGGAAGDFTAARWWVVAFLFSAQIYCDFSAYSDIARGLGKWMGLELPLNFNHPMNARSFRGYWARWHISLSSWFRDYVYFPLGGNRRGRVRTHANLWATMLASALWHGANWTFLIWGTIHAAGLSLEKLTRWDERLIARAGWIGLHAAQAIVLAICTYSRVFFRAETASQGWEISARLFDLAALTRSVPQAFAGIPPTVLFATALIISRHVYMQAGWRASFERRLPMALLRIPAASILFAIAWFFRGPVQEFYYFRF
jgi:D-alanyl-lipoteichoic acid acyltransferase DltB (MBOAT superfamily)